MERVTPTKTSRRTAIAGTLAAIATVATGARAQGVRPARGKATRAFLQGCADDCFASYRECILTAQRAVAAHGSADPGLSDLILDCASMCQTTGTALLRGGDQYRLLIEACMRICELCARRCEAFASDPQFRACVVRCRRCAQSCRELIGSAR